MARFWRPSASIHSRLFHSSSRRGQRPICTPGPRSRQPDSLRVLPPPVSGRARPFLLPCLLRPAGLHSPPISRALAGPPTIRSFISIKSWTTWCVPGPGHTKWGWSRGLTVQWKRQIKNRLGKRITKYDEGRRECNLGFKRCAWVGRSLLQACLFSNAPGGT